MQNLNKFLQTRYNFIYNFVFIFIILTLLNLMSIIQPFYADEKPLAWAMNYSALLKQISNNYYLGIHNASAGFIYQLIFTPIFSFFNFNSTFIHIICTLFSSISIAALIKTLFEEIDLKKLLYTALILFSSAQLLINFSLLRHEVFVLNTLFICLYSIKNNKLYLKYISLLFLALSYKFGILLIIAILLVNLDGYLLNKENRLRENIILFVLTLAWSIIYYQSYQKYGFFTIAYSQFEQITKSYINDFFKALNYIFLKDGRFILTTFLTYLLRSKKLSFKFNRINKILTTTFTISLILIPTFNFDPKNMYIPLSLFIILSIQALTNLKLKPILYLLFFSISLSNSFLSHEVFTFRSHAYLKEVIQIKSLIQSTPKNKVILTNFPLSLYLNFPQYNYIKKKRKTKQTQDIKTCPDGESVILVTDMFSKEIVNSNLDCEKLKTYQINKFSIFFQD